MSPSDSKRDAITQWEDSPAGSVWDVDSDDTVEQFHKRRHKRKQEEMEWLHEWIPFEAYAGESVLEVGCGMGFDAFEFADAGAEYVGVDIAPSNPQRTRKHLESIGLRAATLRGDAESLPFRDNSFDVVFSNGVLHHVPDFTRSLEEIRRVAGDDGDVWISVYHKHSVFFWLYLVLFEHLWRGGYRARTIDERLSMIEYNEDNDTEPLVRVYTESELRECLTNADLEPVAFRRGKVSRADLPGFPVLWRLWPKIPEWVLDRLATRFGWYLSVRATPR